MLFRQASGGIFSSRLGVVVLCVLQIHPREMVLTCADVCANSGLSSEEMLHFGPMGHVSVPFRHAPGGAVVFQKNRDAVPIRKVVVLRSLGNIENRASWGCGAGLRLIFGSGLALCDVRDGCGRCSPGLWTPSDRGFPTGVFRSLALGAMVDSPVAPMDVVFLEEHLAGKLLFAMCTTAANVARQGYGC